MARKRPTTRPQRWADAIEKVRQGLDELDELRGEYEEWHGNMPENLADSNTGQLCEAIVDFDFEDATNCMDEAEALELPRGFGRD